jgi:hypothetical protein
MAPPAKPTARPHGFVTWCIHGLSIPMIGYGYLKGLDNLNQLATPALFRSEVIFASVLGVLFAFRQFSAGQPACPKTPPGRST